MKQLLRPLFAGVVCAILYLAPGGLSAADRHRNQQTEESVRVFIGQGGPTADIGIQGRFRMIDPNTRQSIGRCLLGRHKQIEALPEGLRWGEEFPGIYQLKLIPEQPNTAITLNGVNYRGNLYVYNIDGRLYYVNEVPVESFTRTLLTRTAPTLLSDEALAALAIAIRSNVYAELKNPSNRFWNYDAATIGFEGTAPQRSCPRADRALEVTKNLVIVQPHSRGGGVLPAGWWDETSELGSGKNNYGGYLKLDQAEEMGMQGRNAAEILQRSFPQSHLQRLKSITR